MKGSEAPRADETVLSGPPGEEAGAPARRIGEIRDGGVPQVLAGRYELLELLGSGAMGTVYRARDLELGEEVALKLLRGELLEVPGMVERFRNEVRLARRVTHRNVARTFDIGEHAGEKFLTMEFIAGEPLSHRLHREGALPLRDVAAIGGALCAGLEAAHAAGVVHRDLKPDNVLIAPDGRVVITDFGIARTLLGAGAQRTQGGIVGTPVYMAPEQVEAAPDIDARADLYALGCMLFEMLTGTVPWEGDSPYSVALKRMLQPPPDPRQRRPDLPEAAALLVLRCMARQPADRYRSAGEVGAALAQLTQPPAPAQPPALAATALAAFPTAVGPEGAPRTLAVLPLRNGGPPEDDYLAQGLTEDLTDTLSMVRGLRVRPRGAVLAAVGAVPGAAEADPRDLGQRLGVQVVVEGSLRRLGDRLRVLVRLIQVADGFQVWAERFDRPAADVLAVSDEAAQAVAAVLLPGAESPVQRTPADPRVVDLYLRARHAYHQPNGPSTMRAVDLLSQALAIAPRDPDVLTLYALARARLWFIGGEGSEERARAAAAEALRAAPHRGEPHLALASVIYQAGDLVGAVRELRQAIALAPALADAHELLGRIQTEVGPLEQAIAQLLTALQLDPGLLRAPVDLARAHALLGDRPQAERYLTQMKATGSTFGWITQGRLAMWFRDPDLAAECLAQPEVIRGALSQVRLAAQLVLNGRADEDPDEVFARWVSPHASGRGRAFSQQVRAEAAAVVDDREAALRAIGDSVAAGLCDIMWMERCPVLAAVREDPRFRPLRDQVAARARVVREAMAPP